MSSVMNVSLPRPFNLEQKYVIKMNAMPVGPHVYPVLFGLRYKLWLGLVRPWRDLFFFFYYFKKLPW